MTPDSSNYTTTEISKAVNGIDESILSDIRIKTLLTDSRKISTPEGALFFALKGGRHDGHRYIEELYEKGVRAFVVSKVPSGRIFEGADFIVVEDTLVALQKLAAAHRKKFMIPVVAITGSNGKTIVKEWLFQLLREDVNIVRSPKSYNSQIGVPLSVWLIEKKHEAAVFEAGISQPGEMENLQRIIQPQIGIFTNIGQAHDENFSSMQEKVAEKLKLFREVEKLIYCRDYLPIHEMVQEKLVGSTFTWSRKSKADLVVGKITRSGPETEIQAVYKNSFIRIVIPFTDEASIENAIHCWAFMILRGIEQKEIEHRMKYLSPVAMRLELKEGINNCSIINDSYNSDLGSLSIALDFLNQQKQHPKKTVILSDILQSGKDEDQLYSEVSALIHKKGVQKIIGIGEAISRQADKFDVEKEFYNSTKDFILGMNTLRFRDETILLKGARNFGFEEISRILQQKAHETVLEINLNAVVHNLNHFRSRLDPDIKIMAMVKAFSYGSGSFEIANVLQFHRVDYLAVAYADEGIELRKAGITLPIMVMNPEEQSYDSMIQYNLEPEIFSFRVLTLFDEAAKRNDHDGAKPLLIHLKLDTGMRRLGFEEKDINELVVRIKNNKRLKIQSVFSHLAASDEKEHDEFTNHQIAIFNSMSERITHHFDYPILRHILNSSGILRFADAQFDMVRLGIGMYGIAHDTRGLQQVSTLRTTISQIKQVAENTTVGYSRKGVANRSMQIATIPIGYADGLSRRLGNGSGKMIVNGVKVPTIGNICMDMCMIDVTDVVCNEGDEVIVFGEDLPITEIAKDLGTIPYEVLTNVSRRVKRVYYQE